MIVAISYQGSHVGHVVTGSAITFDPSEATEFDSEAEAEAERMRGIVGMLLDGVCEAGCGGRIITIGSPPRRWVCNSCGYTATDTEIRSALAGEDGGRDE